MLKIFKSFFHFGCGGGVPARPELILRSKFQQKNPPYKRRTSYIVNVDVLGNKSVKHKSS